MAGMSQVFNLLLAGACALCATAATAGAPAPGDVAETLRVAAPALRPVRTPSAPAAPSTPAQEDPFARVYLVTSRALFEGGIATHARKTAARRDSLGNELVLAEAQAWQLPEISHGIHERERHCGGYFAFATRAEAESFLRSEQSSRALQPKALADYAIDNAATVASWLPQVQEANILGHIHHLSTAWPNRYYASTHGHSAALWIRDTWLALANGRSDVTAELFTACGSCGGQPSVILTVRGSELPDEVVVVGGHLDSISNSGSGNAMNAPGADDDASGIATITEIIRIALADGWRPKRTLKFMGYAAEEVGLRGSNAIAQSFRSQGVQVVGVLQLDMTNYAAGSQYAMRLMTDNSNPTLQDFVTRLFDSYLAPLGLTRGFDTCGYACSDHASWTAAGYPAAMMAEPTFFTRLHTTTDTLAYMGERAAVSVHFAKLGLAFVGELGKTHVPSPRRRNGAQPLAPATAMGVDAPPPSDAAVRPGPPAPRTNPPMPRAKLAPLLRLHPREGTPEER
ncbi:M20/M25/M40 family metallo-hydrolase [Luteimonas saliphila]|uniref:M20/M25/M40 family metallo-hydrolase n=1 Tax=Luteimonas saliphila TaxID=2804919 RepID=UPI00192D7B7B|nr:M20/M25/M40 family metallo-hydrolase [Luteimonas saliphila]